MTCILPWVYTFYSPLWDEAIVTTLLSKGWSLGVLFLVRPDTMLISLIRLSSNRNTDSFSWWGTWHRFIFSWCWYWVTDWNAWLSSPSQANRSAAMVSFVWCWMTKQPPTSTPCFKDSIRYSSWLFLRKGLLCLQDSPLQARQCKAIG